MQSTDQVCVPLPVSIDRAPWAGGRRRGHVARAVTSGAQKYDNRIVHFQKERALPVSAPQESGEAPSQARASRLMADDRRRPPPLPPDTLTRRFTQNYIEN